MPDADIDTRSTFRELNLPPRVRTGRHDLIREFYVPCLRLASSYDRAAGYFTSAGLSLAAQGLAHLIHSGGRIRLIASPVLHEQDIEAIRRGDADRDELIRQNANTALSQVEDHLRRDRLGALAWLIAKQQLTIKLALRTNDLGSMGRGLYHEKIGIIHHANGDFVAFGGSSNETAGGLLENFERLDLHKSWASDSGHAEATWSDFESLWAGTEPGVDVIDFTEAAEEILKPYKTPNPPTRDPGESEPPTFPDSSSQPKQQQQQNKWRHQDEAVATFLEKRRGILEMATGTGKTRTALRIMTELIDAGEIDTVIIATRGNDLLDQWADQIRETLRDLQPRWAMYRTYGRHKDQLEFQSTPHRSVLLTSDANLGAQLRTLPWDRKRRALIIHDEVHGFGSPSTRETVGDLTGDLRYRLGLSATPEREYDEDGNEFIDQAVGPVIFRFELKDAITRGILCPFDYIPLPWELTEDDKDNVQKVYARKAARAKEGNPMSDTELWIELARVYKTSQTKLPIFRRFIQTRPEILKRCIIFVEEKEYGEQVLDIVHRHHTDFHHYFEGAPDSVLDRFGRGELECLVSCHKLSEGIDIQDLRHVVIFASARAQLETIQRIGRCLRTNPADPHKRATIVDFIRAQEDPDADPNPDQQRAAWLSELSVTRPEP